MVENSSNKKPLPKPLAFLKRLIYKTCGKARWIVLALAVSLFIILFLSDFSVTRPYVVFFSDLDLNNQSQTRLGEVEQFTVNDKGTAYFQCNNSYSFDRLGAVINLNTGEQSFGKEARLMTSQFDSDFFRIYNIAVTDEDDFYGVTYDITDSTFITEERIVHISSDFKYLGEVCKFNYSTNSNGSRITRLHYEDGRVNFAVVEPDGATLYSIDTATSVVTASDKYGIDADGNYISSVIPVDGGFLFFKSDGSVYKAAFGAPLEDVIYRFDLSVDGQPENRYFTQAVLVGDTYYVVDKNEPTKVYTLIDGNLCEAFEISGDSQIMFIDSYVDESGKTILAICLNNGLMTYNDGKLTDKDIVIKIDFHVATIFVSILNITAELLAVMLVINLIIRKKTLLFKQIAITIPVLMFLITSIAISLYVFFINQNNEGIENEIAVIAELGAEKLDGYDFEPLLEVNGNTGNAYHQLSEMLQSLGEDRPARLRDDFYFAVVYHDEGDGRDVVLGRSDRLVQPMYDNAELDYFEGAEATDGVRTINNINSFVDRKNARTSSINAIKRIRDKNGSGCFYFVATTENKGFWSLRRDFIVNELFYGSLIFVIMTLVVTISTYRITRSIRKARSTVEKISEGDFSARVRYKSKDELGDICSKVNEMGQSLETLFNEKDKAEKFYYKFVPQKFKEYLGKESITDLTLGDASSRDLTVLFCDIRSFSINSEIMTAKENFSFVNVVYGKAGPIIRENNGFIDKYIGDAIMALFENADDAVKAGVALYKAIVLDPSTAVSLNVSSINIGIGLHSGMAMVGIVGESERLSGTVISDTVNISSRLESLTKQFKTAMLISKDTLDRMSCDDALSLRYLGMVQVAGVNEVKSVYEVLDCLPEDERCKRLANASDFKEAIRLFHLGRRDEARLVLQKIADDGKNDYVVDMYLKYITELSDEDKANVFRFVRK